MVYNMRHEDPGSVSFSAVGGLQDQIRELREVIELPLTNPEIFARVGIQPPKVRGPPVLFWFCLAVVSGDAMVGTEGAPGPLSFRIFRTSL